VEPSSGKPSNGWTILGPLGTVAPPGKVGIGGELGKTGKRGEVPGVTGMCGRSRPLALRIADALLTLRSLPEADGALIPRALPGLVTCHPRRRGLVTPLNTPRPPTFAHRIVGASRCCALSVLLASVLAGPPLVRAQERSEWDVTQARGATREIDFVTEEGTWMSLDISPDGRWVVMDLLGHIHRVPAEGGEAEVLTQASGVAVNYHPRYSPDGRFIAFVSDRRGQTNLWIMEADGSNPRAVFHDLGARASIPSWTPDSEYIVVRRQSVAPGSRGGTGLWMYHREGGEGVELLGSGSATWPSVSRDGKYVYFENRSGSEAFEGDYQVRRLDLKSGTVLDITSGTGKGAAAGRLSSGGAFAPEISPDGRWLAFGRMIPEGTISWKGHRYGPRTALWLRDMETGAERVLMDPMAQAMESGSKVLRSLPGYAWAHDGRSIVLSQGGHIRRVDVESGEVATIPFRARVHRTISEMAYQPFRITDEPFHARFLRWHTASPDGSTLAFQAVGSIWTAPASGGEPRRLTPEGFGGPDAGEQGRRHQEFAPAWSPDGRWIAFTTWDELEGGHLWKVRAAGGAPIRLTPEAGEYVHPSWSPDGSELVFLRGSGATARGRTFTHNPWWDVERIPVDGGLTTRVARVPLPTGTNPSSVARRAIFHPSYGPDGRIFWPEFRTGDRGMETVLVSVRPDGLDRREHMVLPYADEVVPSPDGKWVAFQEGDNVYLTPFPYAGTGETSLDVNKRRGKLPIRTLTTEGGMFPRWRDRTTVEFGNATRYYAHAVTREATDTVEIRLLVPRDIPQGSVAFTGARIITLEGNEVLERATLVVDGSRIACVGQCPTDAVDRVFDAQGKTIIPGFVDMHAHHRREHRGYRPLKDYETALYLAYGVTTGLDNSMWSQNLFPTAELTDAGLMIGPRTYSTGDPLYSGDAARQNELTSYEQADRDIMRLKSWGVTSLKQYLQPRRDQRQWVSDIARREGLMVTAEGGDLFFNLGMMMDGQTGWEHPLSYVPIYSDVTRFFGKAGTFYSPTFVVAGPGPWNIEYWYGESDVWRDEKQRRWMPWRMNAPHLRRRVLRPDTDYSFPLLAQGMADIIAEGGYGAMGSHGEHHGLAAHWEIWMAASALGPLEALRVASLHGAIFLGAQEDIGSIEVGKLADLIILNANPLDNIRNTADMQFVMKGGILYDADTLDELWPRQRPFGPYYWMDDDALRQDDRSVGWWNRGG
jgi:Tol biopolymer transport system component